MLSDAVLYGVRTFLDPDNAEPRSPNRPEATVSYTQGRRESNTWQLELSKKNHYREVQTGFYGGQILSISLQDYLPRISKVYWSFYQKALQSTT